MKADAPHSGSIDIERAIETVRLFSEPVVKQSLPTLDLFDVEDGKLQHHPRSPLEKTVAFTKDCLLRAFSSLSRKKQEQKNDQIMDTLQESLDLLKVYSSALSSMEKGNAIDRSLAKRVVMAANDYNAVVRQAKFQPHTLSGMIKKFFFRMAGWTMDDELIRNEIHLPESLTFSTDDETNKESWLGHKITPQPDSKKAVMVFQTVTRTQEIDLSVPKLEELDLFRTKARFLLQNQERVPLALEEIVYLVQNSPIEFRLHDGAYLMHNSVMQLTQTLSIFPGVEIAISGAFQRDTLYPELVFPIKESFHLNSYTYQSGFPHPLQYTGIALHEKLLPTYILRPHLCPKLQALLEKKRLLSQALLPNGALYEKAKAHLQARKELYKNDPEFFALQCNAIFALLDASGLNEREFLENLFAQISIPHSPSHASWYEQLSALSYQFNELVFARPINRLQEEWLLKSTANRRAFSFRECQEIMTEAICQAALQLQDISSAIIKTLGEATMNVHLMQLSEHLNFQPPTLTSYARKLLVSAFRQQLAFAYELFELEEDMLEEHLKELFSADIALFTDQQTCDPHTRMAQELASELIDYYQQRFNSTHETPALRSE